MTDNLPVLVDSDDEQRARAIALVDEEVLGLARASRSENTLKAYKHAMQAFILWGQAKGVATLPAEPLLLPPI